MVVDMPSPLSAMRFAVVDVETSGLDVRRHHVLQVGVVVVDGDGVVLDRWSSLVAPRHRWLFRVGPTHLHGIRRRPTGDALSRFFRTLFGPGLPNHNARSTDRPPLSHRFG